MFDLHSRNRDNFYYNYNGFSIRYFYHYIEKYITDKFDNIIIIEDGEIPVINIQIKNNYKSYIIIDFCADSHFVIFAEKSW